MKLEITDPCDWSIVHDHDGTSPEPTIQVKVEYSDGTSETITVKHGEQIDLRPVDGRHAVSFRQIEGSPLDGSTFRTEGKP